MPKPGFRVWKNVRVTRVPGPTDQHGLLGMVALVGDEVE